MELELVAEGLRFPEGPVVLDDGSVLLVEIEGKCLVRVEPSGVVSTIAELEGGPNGAAFGPDGLLYVCNNGGSFTFTDKAGFNAPALVPSSHRTGSLQRVDITTGRVETIYEEAGGRRLEAPNDLVFDRSGGIWFTDFGTATQLGRNFGSICYASPDGSRIERVKEGLISPNGIGLSPDESVLYVADSVLGRLWAFDIIEPGRLAAGQPRQPGRVIANLQGADRVDSLAVEADGRVCVATIGDGGITVFNLDGRTDHIKIPDPFVTNLCFGGQDMKDVWVTASGTGCLYKARWPRPGLKLNFSR
ncbi:SMP-30/gluconolactonase/LRE family protein [Cupriavidus necator]|uniref:SMP-30/gluconolactonase/LRE family protein n=1 Tax=Cupriavidus necator TaxID=106590 RepID=A0A367PI03_CUPNE|nr:SMP-30/gluconolactonase/LRE family protein [Cupriavidus necator]QQX88951.1 SMP-30/gluconolactonase/LRE family protein [Cupriavidus necator]RCJ06857.1 SMP-30/gluconolactonase/LRE family protein [Cupriavidus necator]